MLPKFRVIIYVAERIHTAKLPGCVVHVLVRMLKLDPVLFWSAHLNRDAGMFYLVKYQEGLP